MMLLPVKAMPLNTMRHTLGGRERRNKVVQSVLRDGTKLGQPDFTKNYRYSHFLLAGQNLNIIKRDGRRRLLNMYILFSRCWCCSSVNLVTRP